MALPIALDRSRQRETLEHRLHHAIAEATVIAYGSLCFASLVVARTEKTRSCSIELSGSELRVSSRAVWEGIDPVTCRRAGSDRPAGARFE
jgi:hypothetical protein